MTNQTHQPRHPAHGTFMHIMEKFGTELAQKLGMSPMDYAAALVEQSEIVTAAAIATKPK